MTIFLQLFCKKFVVRTGFEPMCSRITEYYLMTFQYLYATYATDFHLLHRLP